MKSPLHIQSPSVVLSSCKIHQILYILTSEYLNMPQSTPVAFSVAKWQIICLSMEKPQETWVPSLGWEDTLEEEMATHQSILERINLQTEEPGEIYSPWESQKVKTPMSTQLQTIPYLVQKASLFKPSILLSENKFDIHLHFTT